MSAKTDLGLRRSRNEDSLGYWVPENSDRERKGVLLVVADGMGGSRGGEVASRLAVETVVQSYVEGSAEPLDDLSRALEEANGRIHEQGLSRPELHGMGTTCTAVVIRDGESLFAHVGDSRAYLLAQGRIRQLTRDHSFVAQLVENHQITPEQARVDPRRNLVTRSVGVGPVVEIDAERTADSLREGDTVLLCSDGLHGLVHDDELLAIGAAPDLDQAAEKLIALARERGGHDNITVILARLAARSESVTGPGTVILPDAAQASGG